MKPVDLAENPTVKSQAQEKIKPEHRSYPLTSGKGEGLKIDRLFTREGIDPLDEVQYELRTSAIKEPDGTVVFEMKDCEVPKDWSQVASDIIISKYFRKAGVPQYDKEGNELKDEKGNVITGGEKSAKQVMNRLAGCWRQWGQDYNYFASEKDAKAFEDELKFMLIHQYAAPNSPQWFNTGLNYAYGITGLPQGHHYVDEKTGQTKRSTDAYTHPQPHACFIQSVDDDLVNPGGIMDLWTREARLFKFGSGTGTNFSNIRGEGEALSGGGKSSGLMSFLKIGDKAAGAIKSGGTTRRAAKMVCLDVNHPDIEEFIEWKATEEKKAYELIKAGYDSAMDGEAYTTVSGQNSNNSVRVTKEFIDAVKNNKDWHLTTRSDGSIHKTVKAREIWDKIAKAAWQCADPGVQFDTTINDWHTCPTSGRINASNPCSEYMFLDNTACNLASLNLKKFFDETTRTYKVKEMRHAIRLWTMVLEISVLMAQFPSEEIAKLSYVFRTLGLGYANLGTTLMLAGIPYDSEKGRAIAGALTAILTGQSYATSAEMSEQLGTFPGYEENKEDMLRVIRNHRRAAYNEPKESYEGLAVTPMGIDQQQCPDYLSKAAKESWDEALYKGEQFGYRNAQVTVIAPTGTIGLLMDCDTTGVEPDYALVKFKKLAGGGYFKIINQSVATALHGLGYSENQIKDIMDFILGTLTFEDAPFVNKEGLMAKGLTESELNQIEQNLPKVFHVTEAFAEYNLPQSVKEKIQVKEGETFLGSLGFSSEQIEEANKVICGRMTIEGAPHLKDEHLSVFDCANKCGDGERFIHYNGHIKMMAAAQSFISGAISKTINMPNEVTVKDIQDAYMLSYELGVKANAIYRDGSKHTQALYSGGSKSKSEDKESNQEVLDEAAIQKRAEEIAANMLLRGQKRHLPARRQGITVEASIGGQKIHVRTGEYEDGSLGEIFIDMFKEGASYRSLLNSIAVAVSIGLQYGVPLEKYVDKFTFTRFEPSGLTDHANVKTCTSIIDFIFRVLGMEYLGRTDFVHVPPMEEKPKEIATEKAATEVQDPKEMTKISKAINKEQTLSSESSSINAEQAAEKAVNEYLKSMMGDAPVCEGCGHITIRNGACYKCLNCGNSMGCS